MNTSEIRKAFLDYFKSKEHQIVDSSSLIPVNDETLLFTNAGMVQFKDVFLGTEKRKYVRATTSQRCIRAGGKHNDLENVGYTLRHHTFFEMLGNFSFGDYFKEDAIKFAWEFLTEVLKLDKDKLWISVYKDDDEAAKIWKDVIGLEASRIVRLGDEDNFWSMGDTGPCGPCSEIYYDHGDHIEGTPPGSDGDEGDRFVEIWNLVFMQFNRDDSGNMTPLPKPSVDTGMGLERIAAVMQGVNSNYETDLFKDLISASQKVLGNEASESHKVISDHIRSTSFLIADGITPENEGRGYVLRRILRRAIRHGYKMGATQPFLYLLVDDLQSLMNEAYPILKEKKDHIAQIIKDEEIKFFETLDKGINILEEVIATLEDKIIPGNVVFKLHDTYGFPYDLTADIAREKGLEIDEEGFNQSMNQQKETSKAGSSFVSSLPAASGVNETEFLGYETLEAESKILVLWKDQERIDVAKESEEIFIACASTPFYAEAGGQVGDTGRFISGKTTGTILDCKKQGKVFLHKAIIDKGSLKSGDVINMSVEKEKRNATAIHHSSTHLLHAALRQVLGEHVQQKGSLVDESKLRFDFSHPKPLTKEEISSIEAIVNRESLNNVEVKTEVMNLDDAIKSGAQALFGEKYEDEVRVLTMGEKSFSVELCGGTHVKRTGDVGVFVITNQSSVASGIRRIEALGGKKALEYLNEVRDVNELLQSKLNVSAESMLEKVEALIEENKKLKKASSKSSQSVKSIFNEKYDVNDWKLEVEQVAIDDNKLLRSMVDSKKALIQKGCVVLLNAINNKVAIVCGVTDNLIDTVSAKDVVYTLSDQLNGRGGGRPDFAQGAGESENINEFVTSIVNTVKSLAK
ncbi:MAG: alanine--tRNA ligase [SAR86 cluster bacterium]|uniref:Alanine--tRNA ligase n=1 Tax=SAR86 cluster bacterium TaxID=2030880 RepID=A0A937LKS1_9GAMM|nr:alanine--tRNA ligase [SAR86 cluster bacterium]